MPIFLLVIVLNRPVNLSHDFNLPSNHHFKLPIVAMT
jgi:hypothetical protein